jgi:biopolymer transport protein ExbD
MKAQHHSGEGEHHGIELAPMLDFVLNLLIFFIMATAFIKEAGVVVALPSADTSEYRESGNILIAVRENGDIWMDKRRVDIRDVSTMVERMHAERPDDTVVVVADKQSHAGMVAQVMDQVHLGGIKDVALGATPTAGE